MLFSEFPGNKFGEKLKELVEERLMFYEKGTATRKSVDVMKDALMETLNFQSENPPLSEKKSKKDKKIVKDKDGKIKSENEDEKVKKNEGG